MKGKRTLIDRREFLRVVLAAPAAAGVRQAVRPGNSPDVLLDRGFARMTRVADGVYVTIADPRKGPQCLSNGGVLVGRDAALVIEGHFQPAGAALELEAARALTKRPVRAAVNTHYHFDHTFGNGAYAGARVPIIGHERAPGLMKDNYARLKGVDKAPLLGPLERRIANATRDIDRQHLESDLGAAKWMYTAIDAADIIYPTELIKATDSPRRIDLGGLVAIIESLPGHTPTDLVVSVPQRDIAFVGDLLFYESYPVSFDADMIGWRSILDRLASGALGTRLVPGHGPICGLDRVHLHADLMDDLRQHATRMIQAGVSADEASQRYVVPARFRNYDTWAWGLTVGAALHDYYGGLRQAK